MYIYSAAFKNINQQCTKHLWPKTASWASMWITYSEENVIQLTKDKAGSSPLLRAASISGSPEWLRAQSWKTGYAL